MRPLHTIIGTVVAISLALSHANADPIDWIEYPSNPVYNPGKAYYPSVLKNGGTYTMWSDGVRDCRLQRRPTGFTGQRLDWLPG